MIINYQTKTGTLWHSDCDAGRYSSPMKEISHDNDEGEALLECTGCKKRGHYPYGGTGKITVKEI